MLCTDKEQETCDVEKRGCNGCYYNNSNEEEIIKEYERFYLIKKSFANGNSYHIETRIDRKKYNVEEKRSR